MPRDDTWIRWLETLTGDDTAIVGGKNASLGEMTQHLQSAGLRVPDGFATTAAMYRRFLAHNDLDARLHEHLGRLRQGAPLNEVGAAIRRGIEAGSWPEELAEPIRAAYRELCRRNALDDLDVAVRSSATAEDLPSASFAGQQASFLGVRGEGALLDACRRCFASLYTDRAIAYREQHGFEHERVALSVGVQRMVRAAEACAGVMFSIDPDSGFPRSVVIDAAWGLGESVVQGTVEPDSFRVFKPFLDRDDVDPILEKRVGAKEHKVVYSDAPDAPTHRVDTPEGDRRRLTLSDEEVVQLARWAVAIERHHGGPMDMEWAKDAGDRRLYIVQARPETVQSQRARGAVETFRLQEQGEVLLEGLAIGRAIASGPVFVIRREEDMAGFEDGGVLVTEMTDPDWVPVMRRAAAIVTEHGGRTSHAAIVSRELGVPAVIGTGNATRKLQDGQRVTVDCAGGDTGRVLAGALAFQREEIDLSTLPKVHTTIMINIASPLGALRWWQLPVQGIGLARMEYLVDHVIEVHPMALLHPDRVEGPEERARIEALTVRWDDPREYFVDTLARGIATIAASRHPDPVIVRTSDFKTNEYARLVGGAAFEPHEENPMLGWRGASRYHDPGYREGFAMECEALRRVRDDMGFTNVVVMIPFCRTLGEADRVLGTMAEQGLQRGRNGLRIYVMAEIPSNIILASEFARRFDGFSIGSNDLTQLILGVSRDAERLQHLFDERDPAVVWAIRTLSRRAREAGVPVGLCGQAPSDHPEFARILVQAGLTSISVAPDSVVAVLRHVAEAEADLGGTQARGENGVSEPA